MIQSKIIIIKLNLNQAQHLQSITYMALFISHLNNLFSLIKPENNLVYLMGDFNINLLNTDNHLLTEDFIETMYSHSFCPLINKPTRINSNKATVTVIDNIFTNSYEHINLFNGILYTDITDHLPIFCICDEKCQSEKIPVFTRQINAQNMNILIVKIVYNLLIVKKLLICFITNFTTVFKTVSH